MMYVRGQANRSLGFGIRMASLAAAIGVTPRTLHRDFVEHVGLGPKQLARVLRFRYALALRGALVDDALASGFAEQAHMTREFRALGATIPGRSR
ncbi:MAG: helix-turn-helix domain-containing protein [Clostridia bacterium]|nr:helix-turn-helix domain-containing protein [Deltaproteobacteria bacterium]